MMEYLPEDMNGEKKVFFFYKFDSYKVFELRLEIRGPNITPPPLPSPSDQILA